ncbi:MAG: hypothetical protein WAU01_00095 [Saprospiraceae bacterium]
MRKSVFMTFFLMIVMVAISFGQRTERQSRSENRSVDRQEMRHQGKHPKCKKMKKQSNKRQRKMVANRAKSPHNNQGRQRRAQRQSF